MPWWGSLEAKQFLSSFFLFFLTFDLSRTHFFDISTSKSVPGPRFFQHFDLKICFPPQRRAFLDCHLTRCPCTRRLSKPTLRTSGARKHGTNTVFRDFSTFSRSSIFFLLPFSSLTLATSAASFVNIVGSLTSQLCSVNVERGDVENSRCSSCSVIPSVTPHDIDICSFKWETAQEVADSL